MADSGIKHIDVGAELTKTEWEDQASHELVHGNSFPESPTEHQLFYRDDLHEWYIYNGTAWVSLQGTGILNKDTKLVDADGDTKVEVEQGADDDTPRITVPAGEALKISPVGILTLAKQSGARAKRTGTVQQIPHITWTKIALGVEDYDLQDEMDITLKSGTADATEAFKLHDADGGFAAEDVGAWIWNTTDNTYAIVTVVDDDGELTLDTDIMVDTETYELYRARMTVKEAGIYFCTGAVYYNSPVVDKYVGVGIYKNGANVCIGRSHTSHTAVMVAGTATFLQLAANDYVEVWTQHNCGNTEDIAAVHSWLAVQKVA